MYNMYLCFLKVLDTDDDEMHIKYMKRTGDLYIWPEKEDKAWISVEQIVSVVQPPSLENKREQFRFTDLNSIKQLIKSNMGDKVAVRFM